MSTYPSNWPKVSLTIRRLAHWRCEWCHRKGGRRDALGRKVALTVHHLGASYADGREGDPGDKHDLRRENLIALCRPCHDVADAPSHRRQNRTAPASLSLRALPARAVSLQTFSLQFEAKLQPAPIKQHFFG